MSGLSVHDRKGFVGASEISCILGVNSFKTHPQLWDEKAGNTQSEDLEWKLAVQAGKFLELGILDLFNHDPVALKETKHTFDVRSAQQEYWVHPGVAGMGASPDAFGTCSAMDGEGVFDIKFSSGWGVNRKDGKDEWHWQLQHQMACAPRHFDYGAILMLSYASLQDFELDENGAYVLDENGRRMLERRRYPRLIMRAFFYPRDEGMMETCEIAVADFWDSIREGVRPDG